MKRWLKKRQKISENFVLEQNKVQLKFISNEITVTLLPMVNGLVIILLLKCE